MKEYNPFTPNDLARFVKDGKLRLTVRHFHCNCGQCDNLYLTPAATPKSSSVDIKAILEALALKKGDTLVVQLDTLYDGR